MKVVFLQDVSGVALGGEVKEVKSGFARNYLIPQNLAVPANHNALQRIQHLKKNAEEKRLKVLTEMKEIGQHIDGVKINLEMRSGANGKLYGSVTNSTVADELSKIVDKNIDRRTILLPESIREVGKYDVQVRLHTEVTSQISLLVYPSGTEAEAFELSLQVDQTDTNQEEDAAEISDNETPENEPESDNETPIENKSESESNADEN